MDTKPIKIRPILVIYLVFALYSCNPKGFSNKEEMMTYLEDTENGFKQEKSVNGYTFSMFYKPTDLLVWQELSDIKDRKQVDSLRKTYSRFLYFTLSIKKNGQEVLSSVAGEHSKFEALLKKLAFGMEQEVNLFTKEMDTIHLVDYAYPRMYGMAGSTDVLLVYPRDHKIFDTRSIRLTVEDFGLGTGEIGFNISTIKIINEPTLNL